MSSMKSVIVSSRSRTCANYTALATEGYCESSKVITLQYNLRQDCGTATGASACLESIDGQPTPGLYREIPIRYRYAIILDA